MYTLLLLLISFTTTFTQTNYYTEKIPQKETYRLFLCADPQIGPPDSSVKFERELEHLLRKFVEIANNEKPDLVVFNGDLVAFPKKEYFDAFEKAVSNLTVPLALVHGNHDGKPKDGLYWELQKHLCGFQTHDYAFDCGKWRIIALCAPELFTNTYTFENQIEWLNNELHEAWRRPVIIFLHYHLLPAGLSQLEYYTYPRTQKNKLLETIVRYGNVQYVFMGHVHIGIKASIKTALEYQGTKFIILPTIVPPRAFGEEYPEFSSNLNCGFFTELILTNTGSELYGRQIDNTNKYRYPDNFPLFTIDTDPRTFKHWNELPKSELIDNGDFEKSFSTWFYPFRYHSDTNPGFIYEVLPLDKFHSNALHLLVRYKGHHWQYDESIDFYKLISLKPNKPLPTFKFEYYTLNNEKSFYGGGFIRIAFFSDKKIEAMWLGHWGAREERVKHLHKIWNYLDEPDTKLRWYENAIHSGNLISMKLPDYGYRTHQVILNTTQIFSLTNPDFKISPTFALLQFGVWCGNEEGSFSGAWFDNFLIETHSNLPSSVDNQPILPSMFDHIIPYGTWYKSGYDK